MNNTNAKYKSRFSSVEHKITTLALQKSVLDFSPAAALQLAQSLLRDCQKRLLQYSDAEAVVKSIRNHIFNK